jgi:hypothetical protein
MHISDCQHATLLLMLAQTQKRQTLPVVRQYVQDSKAMLLSGMKTHVDTVACYLCTFQPGVAFSEQGFDSMMEFLYTGAVQGVTVGQLDIDKLQAALQAAEFFHLNALAQDAQHWAALCGVVIDTATS